MITRLFDRTIDTLLSRAKQRRLANHIMNRINMDGDYNPETNGEYWALEQCKKRYMYNGLVMVDAGAELGTWTRRASRGLDKSSRIYSFEPGEKAFSKLSQNVNGAEATVFAIPMALGSSFRVDNFYVNGDFYGSNGLHKNTSRETVRVEKTLVETGDAMFRRPGSYISYLKIDTEGSEVDILRGFEEMLSERSIKYVQFEYCEAWIDAKHFLAEAFEILERHHYRVGKLWQNGWYECPFYKKSMETFAYCNYLAVTPRYNLW